jgi:hypothetical protein
MREPEPRSGGMFIVRTTTCGSASSFGSEMFNLSPINGAKKEIWGAR